MMKIETIKAEYLNPIHAEHIGYLLNYYALDTMGGGAGLPISVYENVAAELYRLPHAFSLLVYVDGQPAGLTNCFEVFSTFRCKPLINIHDVIVVSEYRGLGICQRMLAMAEEVARKRGCCKLTLEVLEGNTIAKNSYTRFGFQGYELNPAMGKALFWQKNLD
jgi:ribosomal protein S18 acetylase RimI-like enzyme